MNFDLTYGKNNNKLKFGIKIIGEIGQSIQKISWGFRIGNFDGIDAVEDTDGIDLIKLSSKLFPHGIFIAQDGNNGIENQNYKFLDLGEIIEKISPKP